VTNLLIVVGIQLVFCILVVVWLRYRLAKFFSDTNTVESVRQEVNSLLMELDASAERNISIIEDRLAQLRQVLSEADKKILLVSQETKNRHKENDVYSKLGKLPAAFRSGDVFGGAVSQPEAANVNPTSLTGSANRDAQLGLVSSAAGTVTANDSPYAFGRKIQSTATAQVPEASPEVPGSQVPFVRLGGAQARAAAGFVDQVLDLYRQGFTATVIASRTAATTAEVDIVIAMEQMRQGGEVH